MELWRISNYSDLSGIGGLRAGSVAFAGQADRLFGRSCIQRAAGDAGPQHADIALETVDIELPSDWRSQTLTSREIGDRWLDRTTSALLRVPSAISGKGDNFLLNPAHPDAAMVTVAEIIRAPFDPRLLA